MNTILQTFSKDSMLIDSIVQDFPALELFNGVQIMLTLAAGVLINCIVNDKNEQKSYQEFCFVEDLLCNHYEPLDFSPVCADLCSYKHNC